MVWTKNTKNKNGDSFKICTVTHNFIIELEFHLLNLQGLHSAYVWENNWWYVHF